MKSGCGPVHKHGMTGKEWLLVLLAAILIHLLLFLLFRPLPHEIAEVRANSRYTLYLAEDRMDLDREDPLDLRYWLRYADPERLLKPDFEVGFSMFRQRTNTPIPDPQKFSHDLYRPYSLYRLPPEPKVSERKVQDFVAGTATPVFQHRWKTITPPSVRYPVWTDDQGRITGGLFREDADSVQLLKQEHAGDMTVLRLILTPGFPPEVRLLHSCGNPKLDRLAIRQLKARETNFLLSKEQTRQYNVVWQKPDINRIRKEKQP